jgi:hypothetical protein
MKVPDDQLRKMLGIANVTFKQNDRRFATARLTHAASRADDEVI